MTMEYTQTIAKAIVAALIVIGAGITAGAVPLEPWVEVAITALVAALAVYIVPNKPVA